MIVGRCDGCGAPLDDATRSGDAVRCAYCQRVSQAKATRRPANAVSAPRVHAPAESYTVGQHVMVEWHGSEWFATVVSVVGADRWQIHFDGYSSTWDEVVGPDRIRPPSKKERASRIAEARAYDAGARILTRVVVVTSLTIVAFAAFAAARSSLRSAGWDASAFDSAVRALAASDAPSDANVSTHKEPGVDYRERTPHDRRKVGQRVRVEWNGSWYDARILGTPSATTTRVHYEGWNDSWDETVDDTRLRVHR